MNNQFQTYLRDGEVITYQEKLKSVDPKSLAFWIIMILGFPFYSWAAVLALIGFRDHKNISAFVSDLWLPLLILFAIIATVYFARKHLRAFTNDLKNFVITNQRVFCASDALDRTADSKPIAVTEFNNFLYAEVWKPDSPNGQLRLYCFNEDADDEHQLITMHVYQVRDPRKTMHQLPAQLLANQYVQKGFLPVKVMRESIQSFLSEYRLPRG